MIDKNILGYSKTLHSLGISHTIIEHPELKTPQEVQDFLGFTLADGLSTMIMQADDRFIAIIRRDDCRLDFGRIKKTLGIKNLRMADAQEFVAVTHLPLGAAQVYNPGLQTLLDKKLFEKDILTGGSGSFTCSIRYKSEDLQKLPESMVVDITKETI